jgi:hypothetical protein
VALPPEQITNKAAIRKDAEQDMFMREVDEAVRHDEVSTFARKYGLMLGIGVVLALLAFGGYLLWQNNAESRMEEGSEQLTAALDELEGGNLALADTELTAVAAGDSKAAAALAVMVRGGIAMEQDRRADAAALFTTVADNAELPSELRDLAAIRLMGAQFDDVDPQVVIERLGPLAVPGNPYYGSAGELVAFAYLAQEKPREAGPLLVAIAKNDDVPQTIRARTRQLAGLLGFDAIEDVEQTMAELNGGAPAQDSAEGSAPESAPETQQPANPE